MLKFLKDKKKDNKGFTLVELVIVVAILAILVGILAPQYTKYVEKSRKAADASNLENLVTVVKTAASDSTGAIATGKYTITLSNDADVNITEEGNKATTSLEGALTEFAGDNWSKIRLKSKNWENKKGENKISATIDVTNEGKVTVSYDPTDLTTKANN